jgi:small subunit ribosomal protein S16
MPVKIRLQRHGSKKRPFYFIVAANSRSPRDGKFIEKLGTYNPLTVPATIEMNRERALHWLDKGAQMTHTSRRILSFKGVLYLKHLMRGVSLGLFDEATALEKFETWNEDHEKLVAERQSKHKKDKDAKKQKPIIKKIDVAPTAAEVEAEVAAEEATEGEAPTTEEATPPAAEEAPVTEEAKEEPAAEEAKEEPVAEEAKAEPEAKEEPVEEKKEEEPAAEEPKKEEEGKEDDKKEEKE